MVLGKSARIFLIGFNLAFWCFGLVLLGAGVWIKLDPNFNINWKAIDKDDAIGVNKISNAGWLLITMGSLVFLIGFNGFIAAKYKNRFLLSVYLVLVSLLLVTELVSVYLLVSFSTNLKKNFEKEFNKTVELAKNGSEVYVEVTNIVQGLFECCGSMGASDWQNEIPQSCSKNNATFDVGCSKVVPEQVLGKIPLVIGVVFFIILIEIAIIMFSICLCTSIEKPSIIRY